MEKEPKAKNKRGAKVVDFDDIQIISGSSDSFDKQPRRSVDIDRLDVKKQNALKHERYRQDTNERRLLSHWVIWVVSTWLFLTVLMLGLNRLLCLCLSDVVCCMLLGTTTVNILGLAYIVLKGLFPNSEK
jgi:hypothetical protein